MKLDLINTILAAAPQKKIGYAIRSMLFLIFVGFSLISCSREGDPNQSIDPGGGGSTGLVEAPFIPHLNNFLAEMKARGKIVGLKNLSIVLVDKITAPNSSQFCAYGYPDFNSTGNARIEVLNSEYCWGSRDAIQQENLIFHELGHALLDLDHQDKFLLNGMAESLMCSSNSCNTYRIYHKYQNDQRSYYLNELIKVQQEAPVWASEKTFVAKLVEDAIDGQADWISKAENSGNDPSPFKFFVENSQYFSAPASLGISSTAHQNPDATGFWYKEYDLADFKACSNLKVTADIFTEDLTSGYAGIFVDLYDANNEHFGTHYKLITNSTGLNAHENTEAIVLCLPVETVKIRVMFTLKTTSNTSVYFDNLEIELFE